MVEFLLAILILCVLLLFVVVPAVLFWIQTFKLLKFKKQLKGGFPDGWQFGKHT